VTADEVRALLGLVPLPGEGGFYTETWRSSLRLDHDVTVAGYPGPRSAGTAIYYFLEPETFSGMHRLRGDEVFHFYAGAPVEMLLLTPGQGGRIVILGSDLAAGARPQIVVPAGTWQGARLAHGRDWALLGTTVAPGFDRADYETGSRDALVRKFPEHRARITALTR
jgi:predicted cupin superfamily sugar epimerase